MSDTQTATKALKFLARALDPATLDGESETSAVMFVRFCRRESLTLPALASAMAPTKYVEPPIDVLTEPPACRIIMPFGKFAGWKLGEITERDPSYVAWCLENLTTKPEIRRAMEIVADWYGISQEAA